MTAPRVAGVILAGGDAKRLGGVNKALLEIGGRPLVERACTAAAGCTPIVLAVGRSGFSWPGTVAVADLPAGPRGPLAGLTAAAAHLAAAPPDFLLSLAVDTPCFPADFLARALSLIADAAAVMASYEAVDYPTNALWRFSALQVLPPAPSLKRLLAELGAVRLDYGGGGPNPFANINTPDDLARFSPC